MKCKECSIEIEEKYPKCDMKMTEDNIKCKHIWSHKGLEWYESMNIYTGKIYGLHICLKCGEQKTVRIKEVSEEKVVRASEENRIKQSSKKHGNRITKDGKI